MSKENQEEVEADIARMRREIIETFLVPEENSVKTFTNAILWIAGDIYATSAPIDKEQIKRYFTWILGDADD
jgi:hypothetical protein